MKSDISTEANHQAPSVKSESGWVLGVAASHNGAACLLKDGEIVVAVQEERVTRKKRAFIEAHEESFAIRYCFDHAGISPADLSAAVVCSPLGKAHTRLEANPFLQTAKHGVPVFTMPHHLGHAVAAHATSGFDDAAVLVVDGMGSPWDDLPEDERARAILLRGKDGPLDMRLVHEHASLYEATGATMRPIEKHVGPVGRIVKMYEAGIEGVPPFESLGGIFNSAAVQIFGQFHEAGKVMGLAPFGDPLLPVGDFFTIEDGTFRFHEQDLSRVANDALAASVQAAIEEGVLHLVRRLRKASKSPNLVYAGGVALNSITNERIVREGGFERVYLMPAAEDSGTAIGAAYWGAWQLGLRTPPKRLERDAVGRVYTAHEIDAAIDGAPAVVRVRGYGDPFDATTDLLDAGKIVGWFEGGAELGPRALGQRSLLCDPRPARMKDHLNARVKHREAFRPFAPLVLREDVLDWFDVEEEHADSPFMLRICAVREDKRAVVPAVVHVDGTGRLQTVSQAVHPTLHRLLTTFKARTGVPILLNTSFNVAGEPIVETPEDALWCMLYTGVDACVLEGRVVEKRDGYGSLLDLVVRRGRIALGRRFEAEGFFEVNIETRYGTRSDFVRADVIDLLERIAQPIFGHELRARLGLEEGDAIRKLGELRRAGIIELSEATR